MRNRIKDELVFIYEDEEKAATVLNTIGRLTQHMKPSADTKAANTTQDFPLDETACVLITYADQFKAEGLAPLEALQEFLSRYCSDIISHVHILPFFPYSSDDGFSVIDYRKVNPEFGSWKNIKKLAQGTGLMVDLVLNHCSAQSLWFKGFVDNKKPYNSYFVTASPDEDLTKVARPRAHPLLTAFDTKAGKKWVWTTFSKDQVDLDFSNPEVLCEFIDIFIDYINKGARIIRLDAIAYLWKEKETDCIHHPKTHAVVRLLRALCDMYFHDVIILTETNVPHEDNISYFGNGGDEAHMVYQFSLPPLVLDAFIRGEANHLFEWAASFEHSPRNSYFNFLPSHDGIGVLPARGILKEEELHNMYQTVQQRGGRISYKATEGDNIPYELNINYLDALCPPGMSKEAAAAMFLCSQAIMLAMKGVPGIYIHSLIGSHNWEEGVLQTGRNRTINREKLQLDSLIAELEDPSALRHAVFTGYKRLLAARRGEKAFHPLCDQTVIQAGKGIFCIKRMMKTAAPVVSVFNITDKPAAASIKLVEAGFDSSSDLIDIVTQENISRRLEAGILIIDLEPYQFLWLKDARQATGHAAR